MQTRCLFLKVVASLWVITTAVSGCATDRVDLVEAGVVTIEKQATGKVYVAWSSAHECEHSLAVTGVLKRCDHIGSPIKAHVDVTVISPDGRVIHPARSDHIYVPRHRTGRGQSMQRFRVQLPGIPLRGSSIRIVSHSGPHDDAT